MRAEAAAAARSGRLVYVIGPSGAGKDSIIAYARARLAADPATVFARRHITRPAESGGEDHIAITPEAFDRTCAADGFALAWRGNGHGYGIDRSIEAALGSGRHVVMNGSRAFLPEAASRYACLKPVLVRIDPAILQARLAARGRESAEEIAARVARALAFEKVAHPELAVIANDGPLGEAGEAFLALLRAL